MNELRCPECQSDLLRPPTPAGCKHDHGKYRVWYGSGRGNCGETDVRPNGLALTYNALLVFNRLVLLDSEEKIEKFLVLV